MKWKAGDKCQSLKPNNEGMADCEIIRIFYDTKFCELAEIGTTYRWLATTDDLICQHLAVNLGVRMCGEFRDNAPRCEDCPNRPED